MACAFFHADHVSIYLKNEGHGPEKCGPEFAGPLAGFR